MNQIPIADGLTVDDRTVAIREVVDLADQGLAFPYSGEDGAIAGYFPASAAGVAFLGDIARSSRADAARAVGESLVAKEDTYADLVEAAPKKAAKAEKENA